MSTIAAASFSARAATFNGRASRSSKTQGARRGAIQHHAATVVSAKATGDDEGSARVVGRREALSAAGLVVGSLAGASPAFALDFLDDIVGPPKVGWCKLDPDLKALPNPILQFDCEKDKAVLSI